MRGHAKTDESTNQGNCLELCKLLEKYDNNFKSKLNSHLNFISYTIQNDLLKICAEYTVKEIIKEVHYLLLSKGLYSLIVD